MYYVLQSLVQGFAPLNSRVQFSKFMGGGAKAKTNRTQLNLSYFHTPFGPKGSPLCGARRTMGKTLLGIARLLQKQSKQGFCMPPAHGPKNLTLGAQSPTH